jgi:hypothetical protein
MLTSLPSAISELLQFASHQASTGEQQQFPFTNERRPIADEPVFHFTGGTPKRIKVGTSQKCVRGNSNLALLCDHMLDRFQELRF